MAAAISISIGFTPIAQINKAEAMGIQQLDNEMCALFAKLNVGTAISATTAGRIPLNMAATKGILLKR